jgi:hypothetical protein
LVGDASEAAAESADRLTTGPPGLAKGSRTTPQGAANGRADEKKQYPPPALHGTHFYGTRFLLDGTQIHTKGYLMRDEPAEITQQRDWFERFSTGAGEGRCMRVARRYHCLWWHPLRLRDVPGSLVND